MTQLVYRDVLDLLLQRAQRLGLVDAETGKADAAELSLYMIQALWQIIEVCDLECYMVNQLTLTTTEPGRPDYGMPEDYGRLILPRSQDSRGIYLFNGVKNIDLTYLDPNAFARKTSPTPAQPTSFSVMQRRLWLFPTPDIAYVVRGLYIERVTRPDLEDEVVLNYPTALVNETLFLFASDMGKVTQSIGAMRTESLARLSGGEMGGAARIQTKLVASGGG